MNISDERGQQLTTEVSARTPCSHHELAHLAHARSRRWMSPVRRELK